MNNPDVQLGWTMTGEPGVIQAPNDDIAVGGKVAANLARRLTPNRAERFQPMFQEMNVDEAGFWKMTCSGPGGVPEWKNEPQVTSTGDSVHSMTPVGGIGANTAMRASVLLGIEGRNHCRGREGYTGVRVRGGQEVLRDGE